MRLSAGQSYPVHRDWKPSRRATDVVIRIQRQLWPWQIAVLTVMLTPLALRAGGFQITDIFNRPLTQHGVTLVDWDGQIANPVIEIRVTPPAEAAPFPTTASISANGARLYFDNPSRVGPQGPTKVLTFQNATSSVPVRISIFPDHDGADEDYTLTLQLNSAALSNSFPLHVIDQDTGRPAEFAVTVDFSHDHSQFFDDPRKRAIVEQAAADWAYFIGDMQLDAVPAGSETTYLWGADGSADGVWTTNGAAYRGFLFYASGVHNATLRSSGSASEGAFQRNPQGDLPLRRSGSCVTETAGNYNSLGWFLTESDDDWCASGNQQFEPNDFYSIAHHEIGHALFFSPAHPRFGEFKMRGTLDAGHATYYHGTSPALDGEDHFVRAVDRASGCGAFGSEYSGDVPRGRWLITKLDLLAAQALGYRLRQTSALMPLELADGSLPPATTTEPYSHRLPVTGGIPCYDFSVVESALPAGLTLDRFTGVISGTPNAPGTSRFAVRVRDQDSAAAAITANFTVVVTPQTTLAAGGAREDRRKMLAPSSDDATSPGFFLLTEPANARAPSAALPLYRAYRP